MVGFASPPDGSVSFVIGIFLLNFLQRAKIKNHKRIKVKAEKKKDKKESKKEEKEENKKERLPISFAANRGIIPKLSLALLPYDCSKIIIITIKSFLLSRDF